MLTANEDLGVYLAVYLMVLRHPLLVARQILTVAQLGPGRLSLGLASRGRPPGGRGLRHRPAYPGAPDGRGPGLVRRLLGGETVSHHGEFFPLEQAALRPVPSRRSR